MSAVAEPISAPENALGLGALALRPAGVPVPAPAQSSDGRLAGAQRDQHGRAPAPAVAARDHDRQRRRAASRCLRSPTRSSRAAATSSSPSWSSSASSSPCSATPCTSGRSSIDARIEQKMILDFRSDLFQHAQRLSLAFHDATQDGRDDGPDQLRRCLGRQRRHGVPADAPGRPHSHRHVRDLAADPVAAGPDLAARRALPLLLRRRSTASGSRRGSSGCRGSSGSRCRSCTSRWRCCG